MSVEADQEQPPRLVTFAGVQTIRRVQEAWADLCSALNDNSRLDIDLVEVAETDLSFIQLLESARLSAARAGGRAMLTRPAHGAVRQVLEQGGFLDGSDADRTQFWTHDVLTHEGMN